MIVLCIALSVVSQAHAGRILYVDQKHARANDDNTGTQSSPWLTIAQRLSVVQPGDTLYIKGGTSRTDPNAIYDLSGHHGIDPVTPGTSGHVITIQGYASDTVVVKGDSTQWTYGINLPSASYYAIRGIIFDNFHFGASGTGTKTDILVVPWLMRKKKVAA